MESILNNAWTVGIGGGVLSGLVVAWISRIIFSRRDSKEYAQQVSNANVEVLYAVRPGISEGVLPTNDVLSRLVTATARKYSVDEADMMDLNDLSAELVKEVMDSSFLSAAAKQEFCNRLTDIREPEVRPERVEADTQYEISKKYREQMVVAMSAMVAILTGGLGLVASQWKTADLSDVKLLLLLTAPALVAILASLAGVFVRDIRKMHLKSIGLGIGGIRAELTSKEAPTEDSEANQAPPPDGSGRR